MLKIYNTLTKQKEEFHPIMEEHNRVYMFVCGPTVYDSPHIGHARSYIFFDMVAKYLRYKGYSVFYIQNITDIDDKIIKRAKEEGVTWKDIALKYEKEYFEMMERLYVDSVNLYARATEHIPEIIDQVKRLMEKGYAYESADGVYFDITKFPEYGKLSGQKLEELKAGARVEVSEHKRHPYDFALWKKQKPGEPAWDSPWGKGRPGWHIEDTAISERYLGQQYDLHGGGIDLIFPHHECEIAQMEAVSGKKPFVRYWMHNAFLKIEGEKMSKSLKNFITIREALEKTKPEVLRFYLLSAHYRSPFDFTEKGFEEMKRRWERLASVVRKLLELEQKARDEEARDHVIKALENVHKKWEEAMDDDFNTPKAYAALYEWESIVNKYIVPQPIKKEVEKALEYLRIWDSVLCFFRGILKGEGQEFKEKLEKVMDVIIDIRKRLRQMKLYEISDEIRARLKEVGIQLCDKGEETEWEMV